MQQIRTLMFPSEGLLDLGNQHGLGSTFVILYQHNSIVI